MSQVFVIMHKCEHEICFNLTRNPRFCSRSCSATVTNKETIKSKRKIRFCKLCKQELSYISREYRRRRYCDKCAKIKIYSTESLTLGAVQKARKYQKSSRVRDLARTKYRKSDRPKYCVKCGYDKHYEVCHIKAVKDYPLNTLIKTINGFNNLIALCPNHHWELDAGLLIL